MDTGPAAGRGLQPLPKGKKKWEEHVAGVVTRLVAALEPDDVVLGGGNRPGRLSDRMPHPMVGGFACCPSASPVGQ
jgi:hypothetical protein